MARIKNAETMYVGKEPNGFHCHKESAILIDYYNWYSYYHESTNRKWVSEWMKTMKYSPSSILLIEQLPDKNFTNFICATAKMLLNGNTLPESCISKLKNFIDLSVKINHRSEKDTVTHIPDFENPLIEYFDEALDKLYDSKYRLVLEIPADLRELKIRAGKVKQAVDYYKKLSDELQSNDPVIKESHHLKPKQMKVYIQFVDDILSFLGQKQDSIPVIVRKRKPRKKNPIKMTSKVQYLNEFPELKLKSLSPTQIIGASQCWLYNVRYKTLTRLTAKSEGLSIKGTTVIGFDENKSLGKRLRKPEQQLPDVLAAGKVALRTVLEKIKTKGLPAKGRMGKDTVILRIDK